MGLFRSTGSFVANTAKNAAGGESIKIGYRLMRRQWNLVTNKSCPNCSKGSLFSFYGDPESGEVARFRGCNSCDYYEAWDTEKDNSSMDRLRAIAHERLFSDPEKCVRRMRSMLFASRCWYSMAVCCVAYAAYTVMSGLSILIFINVMGVAMFMFIRGIAAAYRFWQVKENTVFVSGSFKRWITLGKWLV